MTRKSKFLFGSFLIVAAVATLIYSAMQETSSYFLTMEEYAASEGRHDGKPLRLAGRVAEDTIDWDPRTLDLAFVIQPIPEKADIHIERVAIELPEGAVTTLPVEFNGILPDMFAEGRDVIIEGSVTGGVFTADTLLTTCPSKYEAEVTEESSAGVAKPAAAL
ncbi:MAG: cytochrome c maturation protein CcmE [bacterium]